MRGDQIDREISEMEQQEKLLSLESQSEEDYLNS
jgi:hypothetical protein